MGIVLNFEITNVDYKLNMLFKKCIYKNDGVTGYGVMFAAHQYPPGTSFHPESHIYMSFFDLDCVEQS